MSSTEHFIEFEFEFEFELVGFLALFTVEAKGSEGLNFFFEPKRNRTRGPFKTRFPATTTATNAAAKVGPKPA